MHGDQRKKSTRGRLSRIMGARGAAFGALAAAGCLWGTGFIFGKIALTQVGVGHMVLYRFVFASLGFLIVLALKPIRIERRDWPALLVTAAVGVPLQFIVQFEGLARTTASHAALMVGTTPMLLAATAAVIFRERLNRTVWLAVAASTGGVGLVVVSIGPGPSNASQAASPPTLSGDLLVIGSVAATVAWILISKNLMYRYPPVTLASYIFIVGSVMLTLWVLITDGTPPTALRPLTWTMLIAQGVLATTATTLLWNWGLSRVPASQAGVFLNLEPVVGTILGVTLLHEALAISAIGGGVLIILAAVMVTLQDRNS